MYITQVAPCTRLVLLWYPGTAVCNVLAIPLRERQAHALCLNLKFEYNNTLNMTSCEPARCSAYSSDFRWRMVWQTEALGLSSEQVIRPQLSSGARVTIAWVRMRPALQERCKPL